MSHLDCINWTTCYLFYLYCLFSLSLFICLSAFIVFKEQHEDSLKSLLVRVTAESHAGLEQHEGKEFTALIAFAYLYYLIAAVIFSRLPWFCLVSMTCCPALISWGFCRSDTGHYLPSAHPGFCVCVS